MSVSASPAPAARKTPDRLSFLKLAGPGLVVAATGFVRMAFLASVKEAKFRTFVTPGQVLSVTADLVHEGSGYAMTNAAITCDGRAICNATLAFRVLDFPSPELAKHMFDTAARIGLQTPEAATHG